MTFDGIVCHFNENKEEKKLNKILKESKFNPFRELEINKLPKF